MLFVFEKYQATRDYTSLPPEASALVNSTEGVGALSLEQGKLLTFTSTNSLSSDCARL